jgi:hypothetical protein
MDTAISRRLYYTLTVARHAEHCHAALICLLSFRIPGNLSQSAKQHALTYQCGRLKYLAAPYVVVILPGRCQEQMDVA